MYTRCTFNEFRCRSLQCARAKRDTAVGFWFTSIGKVSLIGKLSHHRDISNPPGGIPSLSHPQIPLSQYLKSGVLYKGPTRGIRFFGLS